MHKEAVLYSRKSCLIQLNVSVLLWGGTALFARTIDLSPVVITCIRSLMAALVLLLYIAATRKRLLPRKRADLRGLLLMGVCLCLHWVTYFSAIQLTTVAVAIVALHAHPVLTICAEPLFSREKYRLSNLLLGGIVLVGLVILVPEYRLSSSMFRGVMLGLVSAAFVAGRTLLSRAYVNRYSGSTIMFYQTSVTACLLLPLVAVSQSWPQPQHVGGLLLLAVGFTALPHTLFTNSFLHLTAASVSIIASLLPLYGIFFAWVLLQEVPSLRTIAGGAVVLAAVFFENVRAMTKEKPALPAEFNSTGV